jgi:hypothetical protein
MVGVNRLLAPLERLACFIRPGGFNTEVVGVWAQQQSRRTSLILLVYWTLKAEDCSGDSSEIIPLTRTCKKGFLVDLNFLVETGHVEFINLQKQGNI